MWAGHCRSIQGASSVNIWLGWRVSSNLPPSDISRYPIGLLSQECNERHSDLAFISTLSIFHIIYFIGPSLTIWSVHVFATYYRYLSLSKFYPIFLYERCFAVSTWFRAWSCCCCWPAGDFILLFINTQILRLGSHLGTSLDKWLETGG